MKKFVLLFILVLTSMSMAQVYPQVSIYDIQYLPDSVIALGDAPSPLDGDTVIVTGICLVSPLVNAQTDRRPIIAAGSRWVTYVQDPDHDIWGGLNVLQNDTTGDNQLTGFQNLDTADVFQFVAVVDEYFTTTEGFVLLEPISEVEVLETLPSRPAPTELSISDFMNEGQYVNQAEMYEGQYVVIREGVTSDRSTSSGTFRINDGNGNYINMYDQSGYFTLRGHRLTGVTDYEPPLDGSRVEMIRGIINTRNDGYYIVPLYPGDLVTSFEAPNIQTVDRTQAKANKNQPVDVEAKVAPGAANISEVEVFYQVNGGVWDSVAMSAAGDSIYTGQIPGIDADSAIVKYFIKAEDIEGYTNTNPFDTASARYFYMVKDGAITIQDVQYSPFGSGYSSMHNFEVTVQGVVTADSNNFASYVYIQNGEGPWSGIRIVGSFVDTLVKGDLVQVTGIVNENFSVTNLGNVSDGVEFTLISEGNPVPAPAVITTGEIAQNANGVISAEMWESVLVKFENVAVVAANADGANNYGEMLIDDNTGGTRVEIEEGFHKYHNNYPGAGDNPMKTVEVLSGDSFDAITGVMYYSFGDYKLLPRQDSDFEGYTTSVEGEESVTPSVYSVSQNYPNPFNPATTIQYALPEASAVSVKVYDILGREVAELVNEFKNAGTYKVSFDASKLSSGVYIYRVEAGKYNTVKKMILMK